MPAEGKRLVEIALGMFPAQAATHKSKIALVKQRRPMLKVRPLSAETVMSSARVK